jgi:hypothetical protein
MNIIRYFLRFSAIDRVFTTKGELSHHNPFYAFENLFRTENPAKFVASLNF